MQSCPVRISKMGNAKNQASHLRIPKTGMSLKHFFSYKGYVEYPYFLKICPKTNSIFNTQIFSIYYVHLF